MGNSSASTTKSEPMTTTAPETRPAGTWSEAAGDCCIAAYGAHMKKSSPSLRVDIGQGWRSTECQNSLRFAS